MAYFSPSTKEITAKIVYYGPGMCGKTTNLQKVHELMKPQMRGELLSVATETDRTIYFDFLPVKLGKIAGFDFVVRVFTVPGQPYYAETRRIVLQGADAVVFVADSQRFMLDQNRDSLLDLKKNMRANGLDYNTTPLVLQYNKQDLPDVLPAEDLNAALNDRGVRVFLASAHTGQNVVETLKYVTMAVFKHVRDSNTRGSARPKAKPVAAPAPGRDLSDGTRPNAALPRPAAVAEPGRETAGADNPWSGVRSVPEAAAVPPPVVQPNVPAPLEVLVGQVVEASAGQTNAPMPSREALAMQEFNNLVVLHHKLVERVAVLEADLTRVKRDYGDIKALLGRKLQ
ncbi:MAG: GTP-binding protein [Deltaproteobacteria bacterium]|nr:GTP-binding protein [Deltaproteobacteria bacterium]